GIVGVRYLNLERHVGAAGSAIAAELGISLTQLAHIAHAVLDEMRRRGVLSRPMLMYHPSNPSCPEEFGTPADWERRIKRPAGVVCTPDGQPIGYMDRAEVEDGITIHNAWRRPKAGGRAPALPRKVEHLLKGFGGAKLTEDAMLGILRLLMAGPRLI